MSFFIILLCLTYSFADKSVPSVEFSDDSENGEIEFGKSVSSEIYSGLHENDVSSVNDDKFLSNFKSLHNSTDLQALASNTAIESTSDGQKLSVDSAASRSDSATRVLRGAESDLLSVATLEHPLFAPFKHNKIDTADFSDCALQGQWKPIGVPSGHYGHHEDHQKEHFHSVAEGPEAFPSIPVPNHQHSPLDADGLAFWNQFIKETEKNQHLNHHDKYPKKQKQHPHHTKNNHIKHQIRQPPPPPLPIKQLDVFESIRQPQGDVNVFEIQEKPHYSDSIGHPQSLVLNQPSFTDSHFDNLQNHQGPQVLLNNQQVHAALHNEDFLQPPPAPHRFQQKKPYPPLERPKPSPPKPKYAHKPHKTHHRVKGPAALRQPPPVSEHHDQHHNDQHDQHHNNHHDQRDHHHQHDQRNHHQHHGPHDQLVNNQNHDHHNHNQNHEHHDQRDHHQHHNHHDSVGGNSFERPSDPSSFTCGHNHEHGTNYHTASYQVEGESDPSLLEDIHGSNLDSAPIIVGQPSFQHSVNNDLYDEQQLRYPKQHSHEVLDLEEEGTDTGEDEDASKDFIKIRPHAEKLIQNGKESEATTQVNKLETTAPQTFQNEPNSQSNLQILALFNENVKYASTAAPNFKVGFDHSGFSEVQSDPLSLEVGSSERFNIKTPFTTDYKKNSKAGSVVVVNNEHAVSHSDPAGFFSSDFPTFSEFSFGSQEKPSNALARYPQSKGSEKFHSQTPPTSFTDFSFPPYPSLPNSKPQKGSIAVFDHHPTPNKTKTHINPKRKHPHKHYEVSENSGEMIPLSAFFPPRKMPKQFDMRTPNLAVPKGKRPKTTPPPPPPPKFQSTVNIDGSNMAIYQSHPRNKVTKIRLKSKQNRGATRYTEPDFRRSLTIMSRIH